MGKRAVIYARVSYDDRDTDGRNLTGQLEMGRDYCHRKGYQVISEMAEDNRGASGAEINLPQLNKALEMARSGLFDVLVIRELDRLSRDVGKLYIVEKELRRYKVGIEYVLNDFPDTPAGQLMKNMYASFAQFELEEIKLRLMRGRQNSVRTGKVLITNNGPYGYKKYKDEQRIYLKPDPQAAAVVEDIFEWYAINNLPICDIKVKLDESDAPKPEAFGRKRSGGWPKPTIRRILRSSTYIGEWTYAIKGGETLVVDVPPIVDRGLWEAAQALLDENKALSMHNTQHKYLFGHRIICGNCGQYMVCHPQYAGEKVYLYYSCGGERHDHTYGCKGFRIRADVAETLTWNWLSRILRDPERLREEIDLYQTRAERENAPVLEQLRITDSLIGENQKKLDKLIDLYMSGTYPLEVIQERKARLEQTINSLSQQRETVAANLSGKILTPDQVDNLLSFADEIGYKLDTASFEEKRQIFHLLNVSALLEKTDGKKIFHVQCAIEPQPERFIIGKICTN